MRGSNIGLALQGGGSYAAFTSGVLKALLNKRRRFLDPRKILSVSGTSGGALNAMLLGQALHQQAANPVRYVERLWQLNRLERVLKQRFRPFQLLPDEAVAALVGMGRELAGVSPHLHAASSEQLKTTAMDCLRELLREAAPDLPDDPAAELFPARRPYVTVAATEVRSAQAHYFTNDRRMIRKFERFEISRQRRVVRPLALEGVLASVAHPMVFHPVTIGEDMYWDGYYTCNPPFVYLFRQGCDEVVLVRLVQRERTDLDEGVGAVKDRIEEIVQNTTINMEILAYLAMREVLLSSRPEGVDLKLGLKPFTPAAIFHEIRLLKPGNIADEGYPMAGLVEKLIRLGRKAVEDKRGFIDTYRASSPGLQVVSEVSFDSEEVRSYSVDLDKLLFEEQGIQAATAEPQAEAGFLSFFRRLFD